MLWGFCFFLFQAFVLAFASASFFFGQNTTFRLFVVGLLLLKLASYGVFLLFFGGALISLVDFVLGALLSFVMFICLVYFLSRASLAG